MLKVFQKEFFKDSIIITIFTILSKSIGFLLPIIYSRYFGISSDFDLFIFTFSIVIFIASVLALSISNVMVPFYIESKENNENKEKLDNFIGGILSYGGLVAFLVIIIFGIFVRYLSNTHFENGVFEIFVKLSPIIVLIIISSIFEGILNASKKFIYPAISLSIKNFIAILVIIIFNKYIGINSIIVGMIVGEALKLFFLFYTIKKTTKLRFGFNLMISEKLKTFFLVSIYQIAGAVAININPVIDKLFALRLEQGSVSLLYYADRLYTIPITVFISGVLIVLLSHLSEMYYKNGIEVFIKAIKKGIIFLLPFLILLQIIIMVFSNEITSIIFYKQGTIGLSTIKEITRIFIGYFFGFIPHIVGQIYVKGIMVMKKSKILMYSAFISITLNLFLNIFLSKYYGLVGIAISTSICNFVSMIYLKQSFKKICLQNK